MRPSRERAENTSSCSRPNGEPGNFARRDMSFVTTKQANGKRGSKSRKRRCEQQLHACSNVVNLGPKPTRKRWRDWCIPISTLSGEAGEIKSVEVPTLDLYVVEQCVLELENDRCGCNRFEGAIVGVYVDGFKQDVSEISIDELRRRQVWPERPLAMSLVNGTLRFEVRFDTPGTLDLWTSGKAWLGDIGR